MIQQFYFWIYTPKNRKQGLKEVNVHNSQKNGNNPSVYQWMNKEDVVYTHNGLFSFHKEILILLWQEHLTWDLPS